ncbi:MAG: leucyl/phenylalanyl-tRNA--protein transferase, partial [Gammaproteobacteria bacterium]
CQFHDVVAACASRAVTWITKDMQAAYLQLHHAGIAHSIEVYDENEDLAGGLYGVFVKNCFCGESMFSQQSNASKLALITLARFLHENGCSLIDCQLPTQHLWRLGAINLPQATFIEKLRTMPDNFLLSNKKWVTIWAS